ncbi:MAG: efflux RND transporter periplasmic adaptor subunit [Lentisphaerae bacterium]|nr:efflux RND transporter periplasmic adaptor subunit [Lentisphaerota bacterium]MBT4815862.1 efflux RND transporter periplasmic adaptor subunit [Lentisphaerota bacterium]MBT5610874.1 efflux RND transporter periplasmic adaptor subunit [Lentisphaerota bacterium]MBT7053694.1 efflux RND transporter periplasmic adaptor subunit [Lentisphaerota bacterium]MBT7841155.1 efflux RND transporter periplasmic adaptor subunit [Lentisphaerota bacterium]
MEQSLNGLVGSDSTASIPAPPRRWFSRLVVPLGVLLIALALVAVAGRRSLWPALPVDVVHVVAVDAAVTVDEGESAPATASVQAPGWVEPAPHPVYVSALADGVVEELLVLEGAPVEKGQAVARLVADKARLAVARAEAHLSRQQALLTAAQTNWDRPVTEKRAVAVSQAELKEAQTARAELVADASRDRALVAEAKAVYESLLPLAADTVPAVEVERARLRHEALAAALTATRQRGETTSARIDRCRAELEAATEALELRVDARRELDGAAAAVAEADVQLAEARLELERMTVTAPASGIVMSRLVAPGAKVMLGMDGPYSAHVVHLYDPQMLQVRVDIPLADAAKVGVGQAAQVVVDVLPDHQFQGKLTRFVHQADISKNTIEVKVLIETPSPLLKPDMLARVRFLVPAETPTGGAAGQEQPFRIFVPAEAMVRGEGSDAAVWLVEADGTRVERRTVVTGTGRRDGWIEIRGLNPGDTLVSRPPASLRSGQRVRVEADRSVNEGTRL